MGPGVQIPLPLPKLLWKNLDELQTYFVLYVVKSIIDGLVFLLQKVENFFVVKFAMAFIAEKKKNVLFAIKNI